MSRRADRTQYFTKHLFRAGLQCPAKLYYYARRYPRNQEIKPFLKHAGDNKRRLKALLHREHPGGIQIEETRYEAAAKHTKTLTSEKKNTLYDAVFIARDKAAKIPLLIKEGLDVQVFFIKTRVIQPNKHRLVNHNGQLLKKWQEYIYEAAFQMYVISRCHPEWKLQSYLILPNKTGMAEQDRLYMDLESLPSVTEEKQLLHAIDIETHTTGLLNGDNTSGLLNGRTFAETVESLAERYFEGEWQPAAVGMKCKNCEFRLPQTHSTAAKESGFSKCWQYSEACPVFLNSEPHVFDLIGPGIRHWFNKGIYMQKNIPLSDVPDPSTFKDTPETITYKQRQALQVRQAKGEHVPDEIIKQPLFEETRRWEYPLHFLDFEAGNYAVPVRAGRRPYHLVVFQYSCHSLHQDGTMVHSQWIAEQTDRYPNYDLVRQLMQVPDLQEGTIIQYSNFERTALKTIRRELMNESGQVADASELTEWIDGIIKRNDSNHKAGPYMADLSRLVKQYYVNRYMADSLSIKDVVQSVLTLSDSLKEMYKQPYSGSNFEGIQWWQWDEAFGQAKSPYHILRDRQTDVKVGRGTEAMVSYGTFLRGELAESLQKRWFDSLLKYCELDTLAMVMIYRHWQSRH